MRLRGGSKRRSLLLQVEGGVRRLHRRRRRRRRALTTTNGLATNKVEVADRKGRGRKIGGGGMGLHGETKEENPRLISY